MSTVTDHLDPRVTTLAELIGLLDSDGNVNLGWFSDTGTELGDIPRRLPQLFTLIQEMLGPAVKGGPPVFDGAQWYAIPNPLDGTATGLYLVAPGPSGSNSSGDVGIGTLHSLGYDDLTITTSACVPLFHLSSSSSPTFILSSQPARLSVRATSNDNFTVGSKVSFSAFSLDAQIHFSDEQLPSMELVFEKFSLNGSAPADKNYTTLSDLVADLENVNKWFAAVLAKANYWLNNYVGRSTSTIGDILENACLLKLDADSAYELNVDYLKNNVGNPKTLAWNFLFNLLNSVADSVTPLIPIAAGAPGSGLYVVKEDGGNARSNFGLRLMIDDISLEEEDDQTEGPQIQVQLGKWIADESDNKNSWVARSLGPSSDAPPPGVSLYLFQSSPTDGKCTSTPPTLTFAPHLELISIGVDVRGRGTTPLFNINGYVLKGAELRIYLKQLGTTCTFGAAASLDGFGLPLGGGVTGSTSNPVAHSLLSAGSNESSGAGADNEPVNPTFSATLSWISEGTGLNFQLYADDGSPTDKIWIPVQRAFGPLHCQRLGIEWSEANPDDTLSFLFDGDVVAGGLEVDLHGLAVGIPLKSPGDLRTYHLGLDGLDLTYEQGPVEISGGLLEAHVTVNNQDVVEYNGEALIKASTWAISALGSWASIDGQPSLFIFAFLNAPIGGPPFFFVTGLSAGFGYNRSLTIPPQDQVQDFPFVAGLSDPSKVGGADATPSEALATIQKWVQPAQGVNWLAAGVQFTSFKLINSNALVVIEFGRHFQIAILGLSRIKLPQTGSITYAYVELGLEVIIDPSDGLFSATAVITPNSYVIDPDCHLTGGFAFCVWFGDNPHAGDFVLTIGGYHPQFNKPAWYPDEPRLGFNWQVSDQVTIKGGAYFALTPSCIMGGGSLDVEFHSGDLRAWFTAYADFLIQWKPFYYLADIGISIGVSYRLHLLFCTTTIKVELGADLTMWGPPTGGKVHVHLWCVSFTVSFGPSFGQGNDYLGWGDFQSLLPANGQQTKKQNRPHAMLRSAAPVASSDVPLTNVVKIVLNAGQTTGSTTDRWIVRADEFVFSIQTAFPLTQIDFEGSPPRVDAPQLSSKDTNAPACARASDGYYVGVRPMGIICANSKLTVTVTDEFSVNQDVKNGWSWNKKTGNVPEAVWGQPLPKTDTPAAAAKTLPGRLMGLDGVGPLPHQPQGPDPIPVDNLSYDPINPDNENYLPFSQSPQTNQPQASATSLQTIATTITKNSAADSPTAKRAAIFAALNQFGETPGSNGDLTALASNINLSYTASPMLGSPMGG